MDFEVLAEAFEKMTKTSSRTELTSILVELLRKTPKSLISRVSYLIQGKLYPDFIPVNIGMAEKTAAKAIEMAYSTTPEKILELSRKTGDLGTVAERLSDRKAPTLFSSGNLTVEDVYSTFEEIASTSGKGSSSVRMSRLSMLLNSASHLEAKYLIRFLTGSLRLGVADFTVLDALAVAFTENKKNREILENSYNLTSDLGYVADLLANGGIKAVQKIKVTAGKPVRPMLAERMESAEQIIEKMNFDASAEYKLDGERAQIHKTKDGKITIFSRRLEQITDQYRDVAEALKTLPARDFIVEGEVVAIDKHGRYLPFQELMHRRRKYDLEKAMKDYPVVVNLFDVLLFDGESKLDEPYSERRKTLEDAHARIKDNEKVMLVPAKRVRKAIEIDSLMEESLSIGCEGLVVKDPKSAYRAGAREYVWIKLKPEYRPNIRDTLDLVIVGANHGMGRRAGVYGAFLLAAYDLSEDIFRTTTKVGTGFTDEDLEKISKILDEHKLDVKSPRVEARVESEAWFEPKIVVEIIASEITLSPIYTAGLDLVRKDSGFALRFPKFTGKIRDDKSPEDATTIQELLEVYQRQVRQFRSTERDS